MKCPNCTSTETRTLASGPLGSAELNALHWCRVCGSLVEENNPASCLTPRGLIGLRGLTGEPGLLVATVQRGPTLFEGAVWGRRDDGAIVPVLISKHVASGVPNALRELADTIEGGLEEGTVFRALVVVDGDHDDDREQWEQAEKPPAGYVQPAWLDDDDEPECTCSDPPRSSHHERDCPLWTGD